MNAIVCFIGKEAAKGIVIKAAYEGITLLRVYVGELLQQKKERTRFNLLLEYQIQALHEETGKPPTQEEMSQMIDSTLDALRRLEAVA